MDELSKKILLILQNSKEPMTINAIKLALKNKDFSRNMIITRLIQLVTIRKVRKIILDINHKKITAWRYNDNE